MPMADDATGSTFSVPYIVVRNGDHGEERAFMKALDIAKRTTIGHDISRALALGTVSYEHEKDIVLRCGARRMKNVVQGISAGETVAPPDKFHPSYGALAAVPYLIFECADAWDLKGHQPAPRHGHLPSGREAVKHHDLQEHGKGR
jgi:hypothetical protein